jgi:hypothetical protein
MQLLNWPILKLFDARLVNHHHHLLKIPNTGWRITWSQKKQRAFLMQKVQPTDEDLQPVHHPSGPENGPSLADLADVTANQGMFILLVTWFRIQLAVLPI